MALLIPISRLHEGALVRTLNNIAPYDWREKGIIHIVPIDTGSAPSDNFVMLSAYCQANGIQEILVPNRLHCGESKLSNAGYTVVKGPSEANLINGDGLQKHLERLKLDRRSEASTQLDRYIMGTVGKAEIDAWLAQFERLGSRYIGEHLLQLLEVLPLATLGESLSADADFFGDELVIGFNNDSWGKSWAPVSNLIRKKCPTALLLPITQAFEAFNISGYNKVLRLVEDGLFSGTEIRAVFDSLRNNRPTDRDQKVPMLADSSLLSTVTAHMHFGVICDFGDAVFRQYLRSNSLHNIQIAVSAAARKIRVLRGAGNSLTLSGGTTSEQFSDTAFKFSLRARVVPFAFQDDKGWRSSESLRRARNFCEIIGEQLWRSYLVSKKSKNNNFNLNAWPPERIKLCALGMEGLGLTFAFPHSVPRASLPLFWARGNVTFNSATVDWVPLFPHADI